MGAFAKAESKEVAYNPKAETLYAAVQGPAALPPGLFRNGVNNTPTGHVERTNLNHFLFDQQYHTFHSYGFAADPTISAHPQSFVGNAERMQTKGAATVYGPSSRQRKYLGTLLALCRPCADRFHVVRIIQEAGQAEEEGER